MKAPLVVVTLVVALSTGGCGNAGARDSGNEGAQVAAASSTPAPQQPAGGTGDQKILAEAQLRSALLTVADLPSGYRVDPSPSTDDGSTAGDSPECSKKFAVISSGTTSGSTADARVYFKGRQVATVLQEKLMSYKDAKSLSDQFNNIADLTSQCPRFSLVDKQGVTSDYTISALPFPKLGDETRALAISVETPQFRGAADVAVIRLGRTLMVLSQGGVTSDVRTLEQASRNGMTKLAAVSR